MPTSVELAIKHAIKSERLQILSILKEVKTLEEAIKFWMN